MENMKRNALLIPFFAVLTLAILSFASADLADSINTEFNGVELESGFSSSTMAGDVSSLVPVRVTFEAGMDMSDVRVKVYMEGHRDDISAETSRFDVVEGSIYTKLLSLQLPSDADDLTEEYTLYVDVVSKSDKSSEEYVVRMQRESYTLEILSVDYNSKVSAGEVFPVSVVVKNNGYNRADDLYVVASIPSLGVITRGYAGDLIPVEDCDYDCDEEDSVYRTVYLKIPEDVEKGIYDMEVSVYNKDSEAMAVMPISVLESASTMVLAGVKTQDINAGETKTYDLIIVNSADSVKVFNIVAFSGDSLSVSAPSVVTVGPESSTIVPVKVTADDDAVVGTYTFSVEVDDYQTVFGANVVGKSVSTSVVALTVVLVIIFVVLLAVLVVLLTRKEKPIEEVETSYY